MTGVFGREAGRGAGEGGVGAAAVRSVLRVRFEPPPESGPRTAAERLVRRLEVRLESLDAVRLESLDAVRVESLDAVRVESLDAVRLESLDAVRLESLDAVRVESTPALAPNICFVFRMRAPQRGHSSLRSATAPPHAGHRIEQRYVSRESVYETCVGQP